MEDEEKNIAEKEMSFLDHLEELRWHVVRSGIAIIVLAIVAFIRKDILFGIIIFGPSQSDFITFQLLCEVGTKIGFDVLCIGEFPFVLINTEMVGQFTMHITASLVAGIIIAFPYIFWEFWRFISPGLYEKEKSVSKGAVFFVTLLFLLGVSFGYFVVSPLAVNFLANYSVDGTVANQIRISSYVMSIVFIILGSGILFQLPIVVYFTSKIGLVTPELMKTYRKHSIVVIFVLGAMITPPDPFSQIFIAVPLIGLYEISILISRNVQRKRL
ncbi:MAG: twin-arginine translocase subunit TatC, partial [Cyclobacteriaceae bacterium]|nr:twin-arginine translocase subunit TatC [Cyclobacteriaceae bacterium]